MQKTAEDRLKNSRLPYKGLLIIASYVKRELLLFIIIFIMAGITGLSGAALAKIFESIDDAFVSDDIRIILFIPIAIVIVTFVRALSTSLGKLIGAYMVGVIMHQLNVKVYRHIIRLPIEFFDRSSVGAIMSKINYNVATVSEALQNGIITLVREGISLVILLGYLFYLNWQLTLIVLSIFPVAIFLMEVARRRMSVLSKRLKQNAEEISQNMADALQSIVIVRSFMAETHEEKRYHKLSRYQKREGLKVNLVGAIVQPLLHILVVIPMAIILYLGISGGESSFADIGELMGYITACSLISQPIRNLSGVLEKIQAGEVSAYDYIHYLSLAYEEDKGNIILDKDKFRGRVELRNLNFAYDENKPILNDMNLVFEEGKNNALIGLSGSGKTTIVNLIMRLYQIQEGSILIDGVDIRDIKLKSLRSNISYIGQEVFLFNNTLRYNLIYGINRPIPDEEINNILIHAKIDNLIEQMPDGLETRLGAKGVKLSGGQKQRLAIARALLKDANLIIMDEATSSLDVKNEYEIKKNIESLTKGRTLIVIAHRLSTVESMDRIIMIEKGKCIAEGKHTDLLSSNPFYAEFCSYRFKQ